MAQDLSLGPELKVKVKIETEDEVLDIKPDVVNCTNPAEASAHHFMPVTIKTEPVEFPLEIKTEPKESFIVEVDPSFYDESPSTSVKMEPMEDQEIGDSCHGYNDSTVQTNNVKNLSHAGAGQVVLEIASHPYLDDSGLVQNSSDQSNERAFSCHICGNRFKKKTHLKNHLFTHTGEKPFTCNVCGKPFKKKAHLLTHSLIHTGEKPFSCKYCDHKTAYRSALTKHLKTHRGEIPYSCDVCSFESKEKPQLLLHQRTHRQKGPFDCIICGIKYKVKTTLKRHLLTHSGEKRFFCNDCDFKTIYKSALETHVSRNHVAEKPLSCDICNKYKTNIKGDLIRHIKIHADKSHLSEERPFSCDYCGFKCKRKAHLIAHMHTHTGYKPFSCHICEYKAAQKNTLLAHIRTHTGEKPFVCHICDYKCRQRSHLTKHIIVHHKPSLDVNKV